jgi:hypothetical protein
MGDFNAKTSIFKKKTKTLHTLQLFIIVWLLSDNIGTKANVSSFLIKSTSIKKMNFE